MKKNKLTISFLVVLSLVLAIQNSAQSLEKQNKVETDRTSISTSSLSGAPNVVKSLNALIGDVSLQAGNNVTVTPNGNSLIIAAPNALASVVTDASLTGNGTVANPLRVVVPADSTTYFSESVAFSISANTSTGGLELLIVPAGKRLVIEHASGQCIVPPGQFISKFEISIYSPTLPKRSEAFIVPVLSGSDPALGNIYTASSQIKFYVDAGYTLTARAWRGTVASGTIGCTFNYSGTLVDQP